MAHSIHETGYRAPATEERTLRGAIAFVSLIALALLAIAHPGLVAATALGGVGGHLAGIQAAPRRA
jgi:hypothetical protein